MQGAPGVERIVSRETRTIQIPDDLARGLEGIAAAQQKSAEQVALESLRSLFEGASSPEVVLRAVRQLPHPSAAAVDDLEAAIAAARLPVRDEGTFDRMKECIRTGKRYLDLNRLSKHYQIVGAVVHDDGAVFDKALTGTEFVPLTANVSDRFSVEVLIEGDRCVLLVGTGMGCTGQSIVAYELALQIPQPQILKIGTCVSTWRDSRVGTVFVPRWAIADEGVTHWDLQWHGPDVDIAKELPGRAVVSADPKCADRWLKRLQGSPNEEIEKYLDSDCETTVWSADAFYPLRLQPGIFDQLARLSPEFVDQPANGYAAGILKITDLRGEIRTIIPWGEVGDNRSRILGWDMECSALFSAGGIPEGPTVAAALVVSYTAEQFAQVGQTGTRKRSPEEGERAHRIEHGLIVEAIKHLLS